MATTGFWPVKGSLKDVVKYAENPDKTTNPKYLDNDLALALKYVVNDDKTDKQLFVSSINCPTSRAYEQMMATKRRYGKTGSNVAYHGYQSFKSGELEIEHSKTDNKRRRATTDEDKEMYKAQIRNISAKIKPIRDKIRIAKWLYERIYEDNVNGKVSDTWFMELSHKYEVERDELKKKILELNQQLARISEVRDGKEHFLSCVRNFAEMNQVTPMILHELIDKIEVSAVVGRGLNRTQSIVIHYKFIGELDMPEKFENIKVNTRKGVDVEYLTSIRTA